jgi:hypothetical protein
MTMEKEETLTTAEVKLKPEPAKVFEVTLTKKLQKKVYVKAASAREAKEITSGYLTDGGIVFDDDDAPVSRAAAGMSDGLPEGTEIFAGIADKVTSDIAREHAPTDKTLKPPNPAMLRKWVEKEIRGNMFTKKSAYDGLLSVMKTNPGFSVINSILIARQMPNAQYLRPLEYWREKKCELRPNARPVYLYSPQQHGSGYVPPTAYYDITSVTGARIKPLSNHVMPKYINDTQYIDAVLAASPVPVLLMSNDEFIAFGGEPAIFAPAKNAVYTSILKDAMAMNDGLCLAGYIKMLLKEIFHAQLCGGDFEYYGEGRARYELLCKTAAELALGYIGLTPRPGTMYADAMIEPDDLALAFPRVDDKGDERPVNVRLMSNVALVAKAVRMAHGAVGEMLKHIPAAAPPQVEYAADEQGEDKGEKET